MVRSRLASSIDGAELFALDVQGDAVVGIDGTPRALVAAGWPIMDTVFDIVLQESGVDDLQFGLESDPGEKMHTGHIQVFKIFTCWILDS